MTRVAMLIAGMWFALAQQPAAAYARASSSLVNDGLAPAMCDETSQSYVFNANVLLELAQPAAAEVPLQALQQPVSDETPAWCVTPDDPRCGPRDASAPFHSQLLVVPLCDFETSRLPQLRSLEPTTTPRAAQLGAARLGAQTRVERPPRA